MSVHFTPRTQGRNTMKKYCLLIPSVQRLNTYTFVVYKINKLNINTIITKIQCSMILCVIIMKMSNWSLFTWSFRRDVQICWEQFFNVCFPGHISNIKTTKRRSGYGRFIIRGGKSQRSKQVHWMAKPGNEELLVDIGLPGSRATLIRTCPPL
jgi:hypothetical protein